MSNQTARIVTKNDIRETLMSFSVGDVLVLPQKAFRYANVKMMQKAIERETLRRYTVSVKNIPSGIFVRRDV